MLALSTSPPLVSGAEAERLARDFYGLAVSASALPGERDRNFRLRTADGRAYVLKVLDAGHEPAADCLVRVLRHIEEQAPDLPVPRLVATQTGADLAHWDHEGRRCSVCLFGHLEGEPLADAEPGAALLYEVGRTLGRLGRALQGFFHPARGVESAGDARPRPRLAAHADLLEPRSLRQPVLDVSAALERRLPARRRRRAQPVHGDCHGHNLLVDADARSVTGLLDFGDMIHAPLIFEPAVAMAELMMQEAAPGEALGEVLRGFAAERRLEEADVDALYDLIAARHATTLLVQAWRARHDPAGARELERTAAHAARALQSLLAVGRAAAARAWHAAAGTAPLDADRGTVDLARRHRLLGAGAELFYGRPLHLTRGSGVWLYDPEERAYLDVYNNVPHVGHSHPLVVNAIQRQTAVLATHTRYLHGRILDYAERLTATLPAHLDACIFVNSGSEANDVAWRIAQFATGHTGGVVMEHAYHGITDAVAALTPASGAVHDPRVVTLAPPPAAARAAQPLDPADLAAVARDVRQALDRLAARGHRPAAFFLDSALTSSGIHDPPAGWLEAVAAPLRAAGALIVGDEVQYGLGRSGSHFWGFARRGLSPDIVTLGKPVGNGYPMGVVVANRRLIEPFQAKFGFFSTFGGNAVAAAAGLAVLEVLERERLMQNAHSTGGYLHARLEAVAARHEALGRVRGAGLLLGLEVLGETPAQARALARGIVDRLAERHRVLTGLEGPNAAVLKLRPPLPFAPAHADLLAEAIDAAVQALTSRSSSGTT